MTLVDGVIQGNSRTCGTGEVRFEAPQCSPESTAAKPSGVYKPGATRDRTLEYGGKTVPIYRDRPLNVFSDVDFIWTDEENENRRRLEYLGLSVLSQNAPAIALYESHDFVEATRVMRCML